MTRVLCPALHPIIDVLRRLWLQAVFESRLKDQAVAVPLMCCAADMLSVPSRKQVVLVGDKQSPEFEDMVVAAHASYGPNETVSPIVALTFS